MLVEQYNGDIILSQIEFFDLENTLDCGQAFRWEKKGDNFFHGIIGERAIDILGDGEKFIFKNTDSDFFEKVLISYFDLKRDYKGICEGFNDIYLKKACNEFKGIRILKQGEWEALCSFIISQNNNIPRIKGIIKRLCETYGTKINDEDYSFPSAEALSVLTEEDLKPLRAGFRAKYILDAAKKVSSNEVDLEKIKLLSLENAEKELLKIKGVGKKVAQCTLLYGFGMMNAFPIDVWVKRILEELYSEGLPECTKGNEGIAQQYLFHWRRNLK